MVEPNTIIVKTKVLPPRIGGVPVRRRRLLSLLDSGRACRLLLILGPAGCGKSTLVALWRQELVKRREDVVWYNFGPDDDPGQFITYLVASFESAGLPIGADALELYNRYGDSSIDRVLAALANEMADYAKPVYIVLEDLHLPKPPAIGALLDKLLAVSPANTHWVISSRTRPAIDLVPLRVRDEVAEIGFVELRFTYEESAQFLQNRGVSNLTTSQIRTLYELTDGWVAGLQLAAFSLRKCTDPELYIRRITKPITSTSESTYFEYLHETVTAHLEPDELDFLGRISACRRFNRELCELITGNPRAGDLLTRFESDNMFVIPIESDDPVSWYRFHRLFATFLGERLQQLPEDELKKLHQLASHWFGGKGLYVEAIRHAINAGDVDFTIALVDRAARSAITSANFLQLLKWFQQLPRERVASCLNLLLCVGWAQLSCGKLDDFEWTRDAILRHPGARKTGADFEVELLQAYKFILINDTAAAYSLVVPYISDPPAASAQALLLLTCLSGWSLVYANRFEEARDVVQRRSWTNVSDRRLRPTPFADSVVGVSYLMQGDLPQARRSFLRMMNDTTRSPARSAEVTRYLAGYLGDIHYEMDELDEAARLLDDCDEMLESVGPSDSVLFAYRAKAKLHNAHGRLEDAIGLLEQLGTVSAQRGFERIAAHCLAAEIHLELRSGHRSAAHELWRRLSVYVKKYAGSADCAFAEIALVARIAEAELRLADGNFAAASALLDAAIAECEAQGRLYYATVARVCAALSHMRDGRFADCMTVAHPALRAAAQFQMNRVFLDHGQYAADLLRRLKCDSATGDDVRRYVDLSLRKTVASEPLAGPDGSAKAFASHSTLSEREREILEMLSNALSTKSIAKTLNLSAETVKWHLKNIYGKLDVSSRESAVVKARNANLLP